MPSTTTTSWQTSHTNAHLNHCKKSWFHATKNVIHHALLTGLWNMLRQARKRDIYYKATRNSAKNCLWYLSLSPCRWRVKQNKYLESREMYEQQKSSRTWDYRVSRLSLLSSIQKRKSRKLVYSYHQVQEFGGTPQMDLTGKAIFNQWATFVSKLPVCIHVVSEFFSWK